MVRHCKALNEHGEPCRTPPIKDDAELCFWHHPDYTVQAEQARKSGGAARARELALRHIYQIDSLDNSERILRLIDFATTELLALENSIARDRALLGAAGTAISLLPLTKLAEDLQRIRSVLEPRQEAQGQKKRRWLR